MIENPLELRAGEIGVELQGFNIVVQCCTILQRGGGKQRLHSAQRLLVPDHSLINSTDRFTQGEFKLRAQGFARGLALVVPSNPCYAQRDE